MRPLKLYTKTILIVSSVIVVVFATSAYFYNSATLFLTRAQQQRRAELLATLMAEVIEIDQPNSNIASLRKAVLQFKQTHKDVVEIHIYGVTSTGLREVISVPPGNRELAANIYPFIHEQRTYSEIDDRQKPLITIRAASLIRQSRGEIGVASIDLQFDESIGLIHDLRLLTFTLLGTTVGIITLLIYLLFRNIVYKPLSHLFIAMERVKAGDLSAVSLVVEHDEIGQLALGFNEMVAKLRKMSDKQKAYEQELEVRVRKATLDLADRNEQLETTNRQLYEIQRQLTQLERLATAGQLAAQFAHEVGTPLNLISGHVQLLSTKLTDEKSRQRLSIIADQIERIERIVRHMLNATRRPKPEFRALQINQLLQKIFEITQPTLISHNVELIFNPNKDLPMVQGDAEQLQQVLLNIINNSLDALLQGGTLKFTTDFREGFILIFCEDTGVGIPENIISRIFDPLFTSKAPGRGTGIGLALVRQILQEHNGSIDVESRIDIGTKFTLSLPIANSPSTESIISQDIHNQGVNL